MEFITVHFAAGNERHLNSKLHFSLTIFKHYKKEIEIMRNKKLLLTLVLSCTLLLCAACGRMNSATGGNKNNTTTETDRNNNAGVTENNRENGVKENNTINGTNGVNGENFNGTNGTNENNGVNGTNDVHVNNGVDTERNYRDDTLGGEIVNGIDDTVNGVENGINDIIDDTNRNTDRENTRR